METAERTAERWLRPGEVSALFVAAGLYRVPFSTLRDWTAAGRIHALCTPGGHRRYREADALALVKELANATAA